MSTIPFDFTAKVGAQHTRLRPWKEIYPHLDRKPIRLSYSTNNMVESCARKFSLTKDKNLLEWDLPRDTRENNEHLDFGSAIGIGTAEYIITNDLDHAIWQAITQYNFANETATKNVLSLVACLQTLDATWDPTKWEVATFKGKPAAELSFKMVLDQDTQDYYCGYVDLVLLHKESRIAVVLEAKSTGVKLPDLSPMYKNSAQGLGYSIILDQITGGASSWQVLYLAYQFRSTNIVPTLHLLPFPKTLRDRLEWLMDIRILYSHILDYYVLDYWPKRSSGCLSFNRACPFFGTCDLEAMKNLEEAQIAPEPEWDFILDINELIERST